MSDEQIQNEALSKIDLSSEYISHGSNSKNTAEASKESSSDYSISNSNGMFEVQSSGYSNMEDTENIYMFKLDPSEQGFDHNSD